MKFSTPLLLILLMLVSTVPVLRAAEPPLPTMAPRIPRIAGTIEIDGVTDEPQWGEALRVAVNTETRPGENVEAPVSTTAYLMDNGTSLYVAFDARDPQPSRIRAYLRNRDGAYQDDFVGVVLDTFNDKRLAFEFFVNPLGVQMDLTYDDINQNEDDSWDAIWDSAGRITAEGYTVELEIPLSQLRFPLTDGMQVWGMDLLRMYPRGHRYRIGSNALDRGVNCYLCQFSTVEGIPGVQSATDIEVVPTLTATRSSTREDPGTGPLVTGDTEVEPGVSVRWGITPDITANVAINPDFSQVEADELQVDVNNQFALYYDEKRPFFLEGADLFTTPIDAVFTRTVADPDIGAKITGQRGANTFGAFVANDSITNLLFPGTFESDSETLHTEGQALVARYSRNVGRVSSVGALVTGRQADDYRNTVAGLDGRWKINDRHSVQAQVLRSTTEYPDEVANEFEQPQGEFRGDAAIVNYDYNARNWFGYARYEALDPNFRADSGFVTQVDFEKKTLGLGRVWHGAPADWWKRQQVYGDWDITHDDAGRLLEKEIEAYYRVLGPWQLFFELGGVTRKVFYDDELFQEDQLKLNAEINPFRGLFLSLEASYGDQVDYDNTRLGNQLSLEPTIDWNINTHLMLKAQAAMVTLDDKSGDNIFDARVDDIRLTWQFNVRSFLRLTVQYQDITRNQALYVDDIDEHERATGRQLLYSYKINPQTVFFLGYQDNLLTDDVLLQQTVMDRSVFMKIGYAWIP